MKGYIYLYSYIGVAFLLGFIIMYFIKSKMKSVDKNASEENANLQKKLDEANKKLKENSSSNAGDDRLKSNLENAEKRISELESLIASSKGSDDAASKLLESQLAEAKSKISDLEKECANSESIKEELSKAKSSIKKLEDEIDDNKDEIDSLKKKVKTKTQEKEEVEEQLYSAKKSLQEEEEKNKDLEKEKNAAKSEIQGMKESNDFVSTLLKAEKENAEDTKAIEKSINELEIFIKSDLKRFYDDHFDLSDYGKFMIGEKSVKTWDSVDTWVAQSKKTWLANKKIISFIGEFSAGKTTIVNTILRQGDPNVPQLPTNSKATTAIPTYISGGKVTKFTFVSPDDQRKHIDKEKFEKVTKDALSKFEGINKLIKYFVMEYDNHNLQNLTILDTPGFQSNDPEDEQRTLGVVNESDALFWVVDVNKGELNAKSLKILAQFNKPLYFVLNQCDGKSPSEIKETIEKIRKTATDGKLKFTDIIPFGKNDGNNNFPLDKILDPVNQLKRSNVNNYLNELVQMVKNDESVYKDAASELKKALKEADDCIDSWSSTLNNNIRALKQSAQEAKAVPHWETHLFSKDRYEMSSYEYENLESYLDACVECSDYVKQNFDGQMENVANRTNVHTAYLEKEQLSKEFVELSKRLQKLANVYNSVIYSRKK